MPEREQPRRRGNWRTAGHAFTRAVAMITTPPNEATPGAEPKPPKNWSRNPRIVDQQATMGVTDGVVFVDGTTISVLYGSERAEAHAAYLAAHPFHEGSGAFTAGSSHRGSERSTTRRGGRVWFAGTDGEQAPGDDRTDSNRNGNSR